MVGFAISLEIVWIYNTLFVFCEQQGSVLSYFTDHASSHWAPLPPIFSLTIPKNQPNKMGMKLQYLDTIPASCAVLYTHHKLSTHTLAYSQPLNEYITTHQQGTQHCSLHRLLQEYAFAEVFALMLLFVPCQDLRHSRSIVESWINQLHDCVNASQLERLLLWRCCATISHVNDYQTLLLLFCFSLEWGES